MDCYSAESEFIESLDFLSPPVRRIDSSRQAFGSAYNTDGNDIHLLRGFRNTFAGRTPGFSKHTKAIKNSESSTSLVLKKTSEGQILGQQYSFVSFPSLHKPEKEISTLIKSEKKPIEKPLIKVTVIPKTDQVQAAKLLRRRRYIPKRVQSTTSNHENSIQTKNVYLIVAGRRREKVYEIKTTGSAKFSTDHDSNSKNEDTPIKELTNFKHLIRSLNMDRKKKEKKSPAAADTSEAPPTVEWNNFQKCNNCICVNEPRDRQAPKKSRVRIFGQFGISEEDKYVLRYGATVDDKTVLSDVAQLTRDFSPILPDASYGTTEEQSPQQQNSGLQGDYNYSFNKEKLPVMDTVSKESQGTQVNFNVDVVAAKARAATFSDKKIQCSCCGNRSDQNTLKDCQSPMVIISVYPKLSPEDVMKSVPTASARSPSPTGMKTFASNQVLKTEKAPTKTDTRRNLKSPRVSRSPSPARKASKPKVPENTVKVPVIEKKSPDRQKALRAIKEKIREKDKLKQDASSRKLSLKLNTTNATQFSKNHQNLTVSNATQVSKKNQRLNTASQATQMSNENYQNPNSSNGTQVSAKRITNYTASSGTQYSNEVESFTASTQCEDTLDSLQDIAPIKHSINDATSSKRFPRPKYSPVRHLKTQVSNATQVSKQLHSSQSTQVSKTDDPLTISCATQVSKDHTKVIAPRMAKNQETSTGKLAQGFKSEQTSRFASKPKAESGTNTDHAQTKKALVETYTKKLTEQMIEKEYLPARFDNSKVRVNIDGDSECYDVLFNQDILTTDLRVRKTLKDIDSQKFINEASLGNLLCFPGKSNAIRKTLPDCAVKRGGFNTGNKSPTRSPSIALGNNPSEEELMRHVSRITIRDSLEISHRREDKSNHNLKNTQTCFTAQFADEVPEETEILGAPMKHFTGDDCSLSDPVERDRQIRELLGVDKVKSNYSKTSQGRFCENDVGIPYQCIYRQKCKESQVTEINYEFHKLCPCFKPGHAKKKATVSVQCRQGTCKRLASKKTPEDCPDLCYVNYSAEGNTKKDDKTSALYQQLILNRNIQVFLQVEQFSKQKPIVLSRQQYEKVKKTIQKTISSKKSSQGKRKTLLLKRESSEISIGEVRTKKVKDIVPLQKKTKDTEPLEKRAKGPKPPQKKVEENSPTSTESTQESVHEVAAQTDALSCTKENCRHLHKSEQKGRTRKQIAKIDMKGDYSSDESPDSCEEKVNAKKTKKDKKKKGTEVKTIFKPRPGVVIERDVGVGVRDGTAKRTEQIKPDKGCSVCCVCDDGERNETELTTYVLFNAETTKDNKDAKEADDAHTRRTMSSVEIRYASVAFTKQAVYSSTDVGAVSNTSIGHLNSFQTLFRGHRRCATPNLGTSAYSLYSEEGYHSENKCAKLEPQDSKPKKPFLRRLMSCLVMRSTRDSQLKLPIGPPPNLPSVNSSIDSYHISTSLGAVEVSSSIYDTSASFYSNHTIFPINNKIKRGFFSSVRGFLTNRRS